MAERGTSSPAAAEVAAYRTRDAKDYAVDPDTQRAEWISRAAEFDLTPESIDRMLARGRRREPRPIGAADLDARPRRPGGPPLPLRPPRSVVCALANQLREGADAGGAGGSGRRRCSTVRG